MDYKFSIQKGGFSQEEKEGYKRKFRDVIAKINKKNFYLDSALQRQIISDLENSSQKQEKEIYIKEIYEQLKRFLKEYNKIEENPKELTLLNDFFKKKIDEKNIYLILSKKRLEKI